MHDLLAWLPLRWLVLAHVLSAFAVLVAHAPSMAVMMRLRHERDPAAVRALLETSRSATAATWSAWMLLATTGILVALVEHTWRLTWVWGSAVVLVLVTGIMSPLAAQPFNEARHALGMPYWGGRPPTAPPDPALLAPALERIRARAPWVMLIGLAGAVALISLMVLRPG